MYCEKAERDCDNLNILESMRSTALVGRAEEDPIVEMSAGVMEDTATRWMEQSKNICDRLACGVMKKVIISAVQSESGVTIISKRLSENGE